MGFGNGEKPYVSVVVPSRDREAFENGVKDDLEAQDYPDYEVIPVFEVGIAKARNRGKEAAQGDIVLFTETDVELPGDWISQMVENVRERDGFAISHEVDTREPSLTFASVGMSRELAEDTRFDEKLWKGEDTEFFEQVRERGYELGKDRTPVVYHYKGTDPLNRLFEDFYRGIRYPYIAAKHQPGPRKSIRRIVLSRVYYLFYEAARTIGVIIGLLLYSPLLVKNYVLSRAGLRS